MLTEKTRGGVPLLTFDAISAPHGFTSRLGGASEGDFASLNLGVGRGDDPARVRENYRRLCAALGCDSAKLVLARQVHRADAVVCTAAHWGMGLDRDRDFEADILLSDTPGTTLVVFGADCGVFLLYDPVRGVCAAAHAGWRGTALKVPAAAVRAMTAHFGSRPRDLWVAAGPCIGPCCFETDADVPQAMEAAFGAAARPFITDHGGRSHVDLLGLSLLSLREAGVPEAQTAAAGICTRCHPHRYWSNRYAAAHHGGRRGVQAAAICVP